MKKFTCQPAVRIGISSARAVLALLCLVFLASTHSFFATPCLATDEQPVVVAAKEPELAQQLDEFFFLGVNAIAKDDYSKAAAQFDQLYSIAQKNGFVSLPAYSQKLLELVESHLSTKTQEQLRFLVHHAVALSPEDPRVLLSAASFNEVLDSNDTWTYLMKGWWMAFDYPTIVASVLRNIILIGVVSMTLSLFLVCVVKLVSHRLTLLRELSKLFKPQYCGLVSPIVLMLSLLLPLFAGILGAIGCWSLLLSCYVRGCSKIAAIAGIVICSWYPIIVIVERIDANVDSLATIAVEQIEHRAYQPEVENMIQIATLNQTPPSNFSDVRLSYVFGIFHYLKGDFEKAVNVFQHALQNSTDSELYLLQNRINLAATYYMTKNYDKAIDLLSLVEKSGNSSVEINYLFAKAFAATTQVNKYQEYYAKAMDLDDKKVAALDAAGGNLKYEMIVTLPFFSRLRRLLNPAFADGTKERPVDVMRVELISTMLPVQSMNAMIIIGVLVAGLGLWFMLSPVSRLLPVEEKLLEQEIGVPSRVWMVVPAGTWIRGKQVVCGVVAIAFIVGFLIFAYGTPVSALSVLPMPVVGKRFFILFAVGLALMTIVISALSYSSEVHEKDKSYS